MPHWAHLPLILKPDGNGKLSKRDGDRLGFPVYAMDWIDPTSKEVTKGFKELGFLPEAFINLLAVLGWNDGTEQEVFSLEELIEKFSIEKVHKGGAKFDFEKAKWFSQQYLRKIPDEILAEQIKDALVEKGYSCNKAYVTEYSRLMKDRAVFLVDLAEIGYYFFEDIKTYDTETVKKKYVSPARDILDSYVELLNTSSDFSSKALEISTKEFLAANNLKVGDVMPLLRVALAGTMQGPTVFDMLQLFGKEKSIERLQKSFAFFNTLQ